MITSIHNLHGLLCAFCLLIAVVIGAFRHWCIYQWRGTELVLLGGAPGDAVELRVGVHIPAWKSRRLRIASWVAVCLLSTMGAAFETILRQPFSPAPRILAFLAILLLRWLLSAAVGRCLAAYTLRKSERLRPAIGEGCARETLEFCGYINSDK
jgi:hypothetical protein